MRRILISIFFLTFLSMEVIAQEESDGFLEEGESFSLVEEGSFQSELPENQFDYSDLDNPEFQENMITAGEDPLWRNDLQEDDSAEETFEE